MGIVFLLVGVLVFGLLLILFFFDPFTPSIAKFFAGNQNSFDTDPAARSLKPRFQPLEGPWIVAIQPGHWKVEELPDELRRLRDSTGAEYNGLREVEVNLRVASILLERVKAEGWIAFLVPATVPPGLRADAFVSIHADYGNGVAREGFKLSPPFRPSIASRRLADSIEAAFLSSLSDSGQARSREERISGSGQVHSRAEGISDSGRVVDPEHAVAWAGLGPPPKSPTPPTVNMRGYFGFNYRRFEHSMSPYTPAVLIELGYLTHPADRARLTQLPDQYAEIILSGLKRYFQDYHRRTEEFLTPLNFPWVAVDPALPKGAQVRVAPTLSGPILWTLEPGTILLPVDEQGEWYEVFVRSRFATGWIRKAETRPASDPRWPMPGEVPNPGSTTAQ